MPRNEAQPDMFDTIIEDEEIERLISKCIENADATSSFRTDKRTARTLIEERFPDAVNLQGVNGGYVRVGAQRFQLKKKAKAAATRKQSAGHNYTFNFERLDSAV